MAKYYGVQPGIVRNPRPVRSIVKGSRGRMRHIHRVSEASGVADHD